jgi:hypothetical protein
VFFSGRPKIGEMLEKNQETLVKYLRQFAKAPVLQLVLRGADCDKTDLPSVFSHFSST